MDENVPKPAKLSDYEYAETLMSIWRASMGLPVMALSETSPGVRSTWQKVAIEARKLA